MRIAIKTTFLLTFVVLASLALLVGPASSSSVTPVVVDGNPSCTSLGYAFGFKPQPEPPPSGTYTLPDGVNSVTITSDGTTFDWTSTLGMDAVIAKGGPNANVYVYDPPAESFGDTGLASPINPSTGQPFGLSHIEFCYDYELSISKTANPSFTRTWHWTIDKSVTPETLNMFTGDSGDATYTIVVTKTGFTDSDWAVSGSINISNPEPVAATINSVTDEISGVGAVSVDCGVSFPYVLGAGGSLSCTYSSALPDGSSRTNTATVSSTGVNGGTVSVPITFGAPTTEVNATINMDDTNGGSWPFSDSGSTSYTTTFTCDGDEGTHNNTATIRETGQNDSASVTVNCYALAVTKTVNTSFDRTYNWLIDKSVDESSVILSVGQTHTLNYTIVASVAGYADSNWAVNGNISVNNPAPINATLNAVSDVVSPNILGVVDCGVSFPYILSAGGTLNCTYNAALPDASSRTNTATATLQNTPSGTTDFSFSANVDFASATINEIDECIEVSDTVAGALGTVCVSDAPKTFTYTREIGPYAECGTYTVENTADFVTNDTGATGSDSETVTVTVPCEGCTLTPGYWKTHSKYGPARYDDNWANLLPNGEDTTFFLAGKSWYQVLWTSPRGNAYYILAHAYIAAKLNVLNSASTTVAVDAALLAAENFFNTKTPSSTLTKAQRNQVIGWATTLDNYNNGLIGPGHCTE